MQGEWQVANGAMPHSLFAPRHSGDKRFGPDPLAKAEDGSSSRPAKSWSQQSESEFVPPGASPSGGMHVKRGS